MNRLLQAVQSMFRSGVSRQSSSFASTHVRDSKTPLPIEILRQIIMHLSRDDLDAVDLSCRQLHALVRSKAFVKWGALRKLTVFILDVNGEVRIKRKGETLRVASRQIISAAFLRDAFVVNASVYAMDEEVVRWLVGVTARMRIGHVNIILPVRTEQLRDQLFAAVQCRSIQFSGYSSPPSVLPPLAHGIFRYCEVLGVRSGRIQWSSDDFADFLSSEKSDFNDGHSSDVFVGRATSRGYARCIDICEGVRSVEWLTQLVAILLERTKRAKTACPTFYVGIFGYFRDKEELATMRHLNRATGQLFEVDNSKAHRLVVKRTTVIQKAD